ncbi:MAG: HAD family hydrolase [Planctomycetota bacterium]
MVHQKRAFFFDAGHTLLEPVGGVARVYYEATKGVGVEIEEDEFHRHLAQSWPRARREFRSAHPDLLSSDEMERQAWRLYTREVARPFPELFARHEDWLERLFAHFDRPEAWRPIPGALELLDELAARGKRVAIISNWHSALHPILDHHGISRRVSFTLTSGEFGRKKPHPTIFAEALRRLEVVPAEAVHLGDSWEEDVLGARDMGMTPVYFAREPAPSTEEAERVHAIKALEELLSIVEAK